MQNQKLQKVILTFNDVAKLWSFARTLSKQNLEINTTTKSLICDCSAEELDNAVKIYGATIFKQEKCAN